MDDQFRRAAVDRHQIDAIAVMVRIVELPRPALDPNRPVVDHLLPRPLLRRQAKLLQRIGDMAVVMMMGAMVDGQAHGHSTKRYSRSTCRASVALAVRNATRYSCSPPSKIDWIGPASRSGRSHAAR